MSITAWVNYTLPGNVAVPANTTRCEVYVTGGGGGGAGGSQDYNFVQYPGSGGGAGGYNYSLFPTNGSEIITVFIGPGGTAGGGDTNGGDGVYSQIQMSASPYTYIVASGGGGGPIGVAGGTVNGGAGGSPGGGAGGISVGSSPLAFPSMPGGAGGTNSDPAGRGYGGKGADYISGVGFGASSPGEAGIVRMRFYIGFQGPPVSLISVQNYYGSGLLSAAGRQLIDSAGNVTTIPASVSLANFTGKSPYN